MSSRLSALALLCLAAAGVVAYGRLVRGLSWADLRHGRWTPPEDEGWKPGTARNALPGARFERYEGGKPEPPQGGQLVAASPTPRR